MGYLWKFVASGFVLSAALAAAQTGLVRASAPSGPAAQGEQTPVVLRAEVAPGLYEIAYSARQSALFVSSSGVRGNAAFPPRILKLDPATLAIVHAIPLERGAFGLRLDDAADRLYVGNATDGSVTVVNTATNQVAGVVQMAEKTRDAQGREGYRHHFRELVVDSKNHRLFAPGLEQSDSALFVVDTRTLKLEKVIPGLGFLATGVALDERGGKLYVSNLEGKLFVFDTRTLALLHTWKIGVDQPLNLVLDAAGKRLFATDEGLDRIQEMRKQRLPDFVSSGAGHRVVVINTESGQPVASVRTGTQPIAPLLDTSRQRLFVTNRGDGTLQVFGATDYQLRHTIPLPDHPNSLAIDEQRGVVFVTVKAKAAGSPESVARITIP